MRWDDVRVILPLLRHKTLYEAAHALAMDRSTLSRRLARLEEALGARLFVRTRDGLRPTPHAERLRAHAEAMERQAAAMVREAARRDSTVSGSVRVATTEAFSTYLVSEGLLRLGAEYPDLVVELFASNEALDLVRGEADIALRVAPLRHASLRARCLTRMKIGLYASSAYLRSQQPIRSTRSLRGHCVLLPSGELAGLPEAQWLTTRPGVRAVLRSNSMPTLVTAASGGHGLVPLPLPWGDRDPSLERVLVLDSIPARPLWLVRREDGVQPAVRVVVDRIAALLSLAVG